MLKKILAFPFILLIQIYRYGISPFTASSCRFEPTCSAYSLEAFQKHNVFMAFWLSLKRISKCHPWGSSGYDPVPPSKNKTKDNSIN
ncbi:membrane protein insertion efficiency factor YidD [Psychroflexus planctonicus]|uniref:membrane protein insertion efficiency factor YidD n=1 Tax=Psychroflexus planctonicus TaxID=1526575 RepID=UPI001E2B86EC|nr:membrane protein insertion efficiency factor YidD [Psychroflexus planctonicus]